MSAPDLSVVIVSWNTAEALQACLDTVMGHSGRLVIEVIVADNGSEDGSAALVETRFPQVQVIANPDNRGFATACNQGLRVAGGRYVLLLNSDTLVQEGALERSIEFADAHSEVGALGCKVLFPDGRFQSSYFRFVSLWSIFLEKVLPLATVPRNRLTRSRYWGRVFDDPQEVDSVAGCFFLVRRAVMSEVGLLDEDFFFYGEEEEWCYRIRCAGWKVVYFPGATIVHVHGQSSIRAPERVHLDRLAAPLLVLEKSRGCRIAWIANLMLLAGILLRTPIALLSGRARPALRASAFHARGIFAPVWRRRPQAQTN